MQSILKYFPELTDQQQHQFEMLYDLYTDWNSKINVISRKDIENLYLHHVLHSLAIAKLLHFRDTTSILDVGTGGGFPGIPLAILFPECKFTLIDSIAKKIRVGQEVATAIGLTNITLKHLRAQEEKSKYDFVVSRAVMPLSDLVTLVRKNIASRQHNAMPNGLICLKGGELTHEIIPFKSIAESYEISTYFNEDYFKTKKIVYVPL
ncbi:MAG: 16S rRNA (guanine(527)-N(7))-methyltransferase RsmG [Paludibacter sp.]|nr:16S rRNA (guanine(527)-N(7))-methyltransferase RsmG [Paludibacter sp.]